MKAIYDQRYRFAAGFDPESGFYYRTSVKDENGCDTGEDAFMASFPHLVDVGIMGHCTHGLTGRCLKAGIQCYQSGSSRWQKHMSLSEFEQIADQCEGRTFQFALGGRGDPDQHESFAEILNACRARGIVPNFTSSGCALDGETARLSARYCGAVAISWQRSDYTLRAIDTLLQAGVTTNIHYVLSNDTIDEALRLLLDDAFPQGINRVIFLLHKPVGAGERRNVLRVRDPRVIEFFGLFNLERFCSMSGFDSCSVPALLNFAPTVHPATIETCEGARFSAYVSPDLELLPCSFDQGGRWAADLKHQSLQQAWNSELFEEFRSIMKSSCPDCRKRTLCLGGCPIDSDIVLCNKCREVRTPEDQN